MPSSPQGPIRRAQLIAPFGVGSLVVVPGGTSLIIGGLDYWYSVKDNEEFDMQEYVFDEWRLQKMLNVAHFRLPPDYREFVMGQKIPNVGITIPTFRFPTWHFCSDKSCRLLMEWPMFTRGVRGKIKCPECEKKKKTRYMYQVPFVAMCEQGHLQDFPWREWVHYDTNPKCNGNLRLLSTGSATLAGQKVKCKDCGKERTLSGITSGTDGSTTLSRTLSDAEEYLCRGTKPWLGPENQENCNSQVKGSLRSASNLYYAKILSSIYLPKTQNADLQQIEDLLQTSPICTLISLLRDAGQNQPEIIARGIRNQHPQLVKQFNDKDIAFVLTKLSEPDSTNQSDTTKAIEDATLSFREAEYSALQIERDDNLLKIQRGKVEEYDQDVIKYFSKVMLVSKLRETRAFTGFTRIFPENDRDQLQRQSLLWTNFPDERERWLPAYIVYGEGLFFEFDGERIRQWENNDEIRARIAPLVSRYEKMQNQRKLQTIPLSPRFILLHTFSHLVMNRLTYECGYSSAALRERLFVSDEPKFPMAGVLIYTADGDSEGTMGGLVRMGKPGYLETVIRRALEGAAWCSADPVCMEMGKLNGQGPDSCNLAACHNCALVPETACEEFNRFLDRAVVIGELGNPSLGFFNS